MLMYNSVLNTK